MIRNLLSIGVALALIAVLTGTACLACFGPMRMEAKASCCTEQSSCHKSSKKAPSHAHRDDCQGLPDDIAHGAPAPDFTKQIQPAESPMSDFAIATVTARADSARERVRPYYPPDLCLLNSQLTI